MRGVQKSFLMNIPPSHMNRDSVFTQGRIQKSVLGGITFFPPPGAALNPLGQKSLEISFHLKHLRGRGAGSIIATPKHVSVS